MFLHAMSCRIAFLCPNDKVVVSNNAGKCRPFLYPTGIFTVANALDSSPAANAFFATVALNTTWKFYEEESCLFSLIQGVFKHM